jgi:PAS domain S-box-containing protein
MDSEIFQTDQLLRIAGRVARFGGWSVDLEEGVVHWSDEVCRIHDEPPGTKLPVEEAIRYCAPEWRTAVRERFTRCAEEGVPYDLELEILTRKGRRVWVRAVGEPVLGPDGDIQRVEGAFQDITPLKEARAEIRELEGRLHETVENLPDGFITFDHEWRFTYLNKTAAGFFGRSREELVGKVVWEEYPEVVETAFHEAYHRAVREGRTVRIEEYYEPWGRWFREHVYPTAQGVVAYFQDITEWKEAEAALRESETLVQELADHIDSVFWIAPGDMSRMEYVSPAYAKIWGRDPAEVADDPRLWLEAIHQEDRERVGSVLAHPPESNYELEFRIVRPDGAVRWIRDRVWPLRDDQGRVVRILGVAEDVTERRELEERLRHGQKLETVGHLAGGVAHDFNNILTVLQAASEMLLEDLPSSSPLRDIAREILDQAERGARLTRQLLAFSRRQVLDDRVLDVATFLERMEPVLRRVIPENIVITWERGGTGLRVKVDPDQLQQVILNLVMNASDAIQGQGRISLGVDSVRLSADDTGDIPWQVATGEYVRLTVEDTGTGMPPEILQRIFEPFFTTKPRGRGTGLGLPMVYGVVKQSGGHIMVDSEPGQGSTFRVLLPLVAEEEAASPGESAAPGGEVGSSPPLRPGSGTILVVEDDEPVRDAVSRILRRFGYHVLEAGGAKQALKLFQAHRAEVGVVVSDLVMPYMDGVSLMHRIRGVQPGFPVILMSGYSTEELATEARRTATAFLDKPFSPEELVRAIQDARASDRETVGGA